MAIKRYIDSYGFKVIDIKAANGGNIEVINFATNKGDIGLWSSMNGNGLGGADYIRSEKSWNKEKIAWHRERIDRIVWINEEEKQALKDFLDEMENEQKERA